MLDPEAAAVLRAVLDELSAGTSPAEMRIRADIASRLLEAAGKGGDVSSDHVKAVRRDASLQTPTMWR
jgi:hypothetical protein